MITLDLEVLCRNGEAAEFGGPGREQKQVTPREWAAYYLHPRQQSAIWQDDMRMFRCCKLFEVWIFCSYVQITFCVVLTPVLTILYIK